MPKSQLEAEQNMWKAHDEAVPIVDKSIEKTGDWVRYQMEPLVRESHGLPPMKNFDPDHALKLEAEAGEARNAADLARAKLNNEIKKFEWAKKNLPYQPELPSPSSQPSAPGSGSLSGGALQTGSAGVANTLLGFPPPPPKP